MKPYHRYQGMDMSRTSWGLGTNEAGETAKTREPSEDEGGRRKQQFTLSKNEKMNMWHMWRGVKRSWKWLRWYFYKVEQHRATRRIPSQSKMLFNIFCPFVEPFLTPSPSWNPLLSFLLLPLSPSLIRLNINFFRPHPTFWSAAILFILFSPLVESACSGGYQSFQDIFFYHIECWYEPATMPPTQYTPDRILHESNSA